MSYDLHITRRTHWNDAGDDISVDEWLAYIEGDAELRRRPENGPCFVVWKADAEESWFDWSNGQVYSKNPDSAAIDKMVSIAKRLGARVQGDDGEIYLSGTLAPKRLKISLRRRVANWLARIRARSEFPIIHEPLAFDIGDTVRDVWGNEHKVVSIDPKAEHGMGLIRTRRLSDGSEQLTLMIAHHFKLVDERA